MTSQVLESDLEAWVEKLFAEVGWETRSGKGELFGDGSTLGRSSTRDWLLFTPLLLAIERLNPTVPEAARREALDRIREDRSKKQLANANFELYELLRDGVKVEIKDTKDPSKIATHTVRVIDWDEPSKNRFQLVRQLNVSGDTREFRTDLVGFVNGLPLVFVELKRPDKKAKDAFDQNFNEYKKHIPQLFWANAIVLAANGVDARIGTITAGWEHFKPWARVESEDEERSPTIETMVRGLFAPARLLDVCENFILFESGGTGLRKVITQNHQFLGVNLAVERVRKLAELRAQGSSADESALAEARRLGVFWHTQGSGKSYSMVLFARKVLRKIPGAWTFVVVTDRLDLDDQIAKTFIRTGTAADTARAENARELREMLSSSERAAELDTAAVDDHDSSPRKSKRAVARNPRFVFTLIQRFRADRARSEDGEESVEEAFPVLTERDDIILIADEAHRSHYDTFKANIDRGLPRCARIGFTGTPLLEGDLTTVHVFGGYVSKYRFLNAVEDGATVPLYYEPRVAEMHYDKDLLAAALAEIEDEERLSDAQRTELSERFGQFKEVVTRTSRLKQIAADIVEHFLEVDESLKAMVVCLDKRTTLRVYRYFLDAWTERQAQLRDQLLLLQPWDSTRPHVQRALERMQRLETAAVLSRSQYDTSKIVERNPELSEKWVEDTLRRPASEDLAARFKSVTDPLRLVFVCSMWITGFDAPSCAVVYLDRPMRDHALMQTIARANRVFASKEFGLIVDYVGVLSNLDDAFHDFAGKSFTAQERPIESKATVINALKAQMESVHKLLDERDASLSTLQASAPDERAKALEKLVAQLVYPQQVRAQFLSLVRRIVRLSRNIGLDPANARFERDIAALVQIRDSIQAATEDEKEIADRVLAKISPILDRAITTSEEPLPLDIVRIDLGRRARALAGLIEDEEDRADTESLAVTVRSAIADASRKDPVLIPLETKLDELVQRYNEGALSPKEFAKEVEREVLDVMDARDKLARDEGLSRAELSVFDQIMERAGDTLTRERDLVKDRVRALTQRLRDAMGIDWQQSEQGRASVKIAVEDALNDLPDSVSNDDVAVMVNDVFRYVIERGW